MFERPTKAGMMAAAARVPAKVFTAPMPPEARIEVTTAEGQPTVRVMCQANGEPREAFVNETVAHLYGAQPTGEPHEWKIIKE